MMNIKFIFNNWMRHCKDFGLRASLSIWISPPLMTRDAHKRMAITHVRKTNYLKRLLRNVIEERKNDQVPAIGIDETYPIYVCWFQGEEMMPPIVKTCYQSILRHANGRKVILITMDNLKNHVDIPGFIEDLVADNKISYTHFSDIIRNALLYQNGGIWIDATIYLTEDLHIEQLPFFSIKRNERWNYINVSRFRWTSYFMAGVKGNPLNHFVYNGLISYWQKKIIMLDYFLIDYLICLGYENIPAIAKMVDRMSYTNPNVLYFGHHLNQDRNRSDVSDILKNTHIHKLTYKGLDEAYPENSIYEGIVKNLF